MTFARRPLTIVDLCPLVCTKTYGETTDAGSCSAVLGETGPRKCYNTRATCQVLDDLVEEASLLRFGVGSEDLPLAWDAIPSVLRVSTKPTKLNIAGTSDNSTALGLRSAVTVTFQDHPDGDVATDPYLSSREFDPMKRGTFWTKWLARNKHWQNIKLTVRSGFVGDELEDLTNRTFLVEDVTGPDARGSVTIRGRDVLSRADSRKAQAPRINVGELQADISSSATSFNVIGEAFANYASAGTIRIGDEVMTYATLTDNTTHLTFSGVTRGTDNTDADGHSEGDAVQQCLRFTDAAVQDVVRALLEDYADIDAAYVPFTDWDEEGDRWLLPYQLSTLITKPTGVDKLLEELAQQVLFYLWWEETDQEIKFRAVRPVEDIPPALTDGDNVLPDSQTIEYRMDEHYSEVAIFYGQIDPTLPLDEEKNYRQVRIKIGDENFGQRRTRKIFSRWINTETVALATAVTFMNQANPLPVFVTVKVGMNDATIKTGDIVDLTSRIVVDDTGAQQPTRYIVIEAAASRTLGEELTLTLKSIGFFPEVSNYMAADAPDFADATEEEIAVGCWYSDEAGEIDGEASPFVFS